MFSNVHCAQKKFPPHEKFRNWKKKKTHKERNKKWQKQKKKKCPKFMRVGLCAKLIFWQFFFSSLSFLFFVFEILSRDCFFFELYSVPSFSTLSRNRGLSSDRYVCIRICVIIYWTCYLSVCSIFFSSALIIQLSSRSCVSFPFKLYFLVLWAVPFSHCQFLNLLEGKVFRVTCSKATKKEEKGRKKGECQLDEVS